MDTAEILTRVGRYYTERLETGGCTPAGVDWNSRESQEERFAKLLEVSTSSKGHFSLNDYGCGYGGLADYLHARRVPCSYRGFDISEAMVRAASARHQDCGCRFMTERRALEPADYTVASGIFNVMTGVPAERWSTYVRDTIVDLASVSLRGFAFNVLSSHVMMDRRRPNLYYADPIETWRFCVDRISPYAALLHDYWPHEFTLIVRLPHG